MLGYQPPRGYTLWYALWPLCQWGVLSGEDVPGGLQVRARDGQWVDVPTMPTNFAVNIGDLRRRWTNDRWLSNLHRVVNPVVSWDDRSKD